MTGNDAARKDTLERLKNRASRLLHLLALDAPPVIIAAECELIEQAATALREGLTEQESGWYTTITESDLTSQVEGDTDGG